MKKARKILKARPPERQGLWQETAEVRQARIQRQWGCFNRLTISEILHQLEQLQLGTDSQGNVRKSHLQEITTGLFYIIETARRVLLKLTGAPGIITQDDLREFCEQRGDFSPSKIAYGPGFTYVRNKLDAQFDAKYLIENGDFYAQLSRSGGKVIGRKSHDRELSEYIKSQRALRRANRQAKALPAGLKPAAPVSVSNIAETYDASNYNDCIIAFDFLYEMSKSGNCEARSVLKRRSEAIMSDVVRIKDKASGVQLETWYASSGDQPAADPAPAKLVRVPDTDETAELTRYNDFIIGLGILYELGKAGNCEARAVLKENAEAVISSAVRIKNTILGFGKA